MEFLHSVMALEAIMLLEKNISFSIGGAVGYMNDEVYGKDFNRDSAKEWWNVTLDKMSNSEREFVDGVEFPIVLVEMPGSMAMAFQTNVGPVIVLPTQGFDRLGENGKIVELVIAVAHEECHCRQYKDGRLVMDFHSGMGTWMEETKLVYDVKDYLNRPWEREAYSHSWKVAKEVLNESRKGFIRDDKTMFGKIARFMGVDLPNDLK